MTKSQLFQKVIAYFNEKNPEPKTELNYRNEYELAVAVVLSAQCPDKRVNEITPKFFEIFPDFKSLSLSSYEQVYELIKSCSYPNNKAKSLIELAKKIESDYNGKLPEEPEILEQLPGIGRKTAHVLASVLFKKPVLAVDTHVFRVSERLGLTENAKNPLDCEKQLMEFIPKELVHKFHHWLILHGRYICKAKSPSCKECGLKDICKYYNTK